MGTISTTPILAGHPQTAELRGGSLENLALDPSDPKSLIKLKKENSDHLVETSIESGDVSVSKIASAAVLNNLLQA